jgi:alkanesulfonate monooxygenase SsuD/methylene tetrahydromethanopterin reductase-like flavin-dependent oxidoreductase (luciferase family)
LVRFHWFAEQYYTRSPPDYAARVDATWVTAPVKLARPELIRQDYLMYLRLMQLADRVGWDSLLLNEHHQTSYNMSPSPNLLAAVLAVTTQDAAVALCVNSLALYNPPVRVAEELAMLDCLSGGRIIAGLVLGTPMDTAFGYGVPPVEVLERFEEARELIIRAWRESEPFCFNGTYNKLRYVNVWPRPIQEEIPIWVPGTGSVETWDLVNRLGYCYGYVSFYGRQNATSVVRGFWEESERVGAELNPHRLACTQIICCAETDADAERLYYDAVRYNYLNRKIPPEFVSPPGYSTTTSLRAARQRAAPQSAEDLRRASKGEMAFWEYDELGYIIAGTPDRVAERVREMCEDLRVGQLLTCMHVGDLSEEVAALNTELFGHEVIPRLQDLWAEFPDRWTPRVVQERIAARRSATAPAG